MGKSSSRKKKRSDASPLARTKRKSKSKRSRNKSKKLRRRHDTESDSYSSDYSSPDSSYASSEDDYSRRRRSRSISRSNTGRSKKRNRQRSYSSDSSEDSRPARKRRSSRRKDDSGSRKKTYKKKHKRRASVSSTSNDSFSCSTCDHGSGPSGDSEFESRRSRSGKRDIHKRNRRKDKAVAETHEHRSRSCSPSSKRSTSYPDDNEERVIATNNSLRLRSVIMVSNEVEERKLDIDEHKEEMLYDNDDYPSRSNDSNDGGSKRELAHQSDEDIKTEGHSMEFAEDAAPNLITTPVEEKNGVRGGKSDGSNLSSDAAPSLNTAKGKDTVVSDGAENEDLESLLRQKALENLKRFRGISRGKGVKQTPVVTTESTQKKSPEDVSAGLEDPVQSKGNKMSVWKRISTGKTSVKSNIVDHKYEAVGPPSSSGESVQMSGGGSGSFPANRPKTTPFTWRRDSAKPEPPVKELTHLPKEPPRAKLLETKVAANVNAANPARFGTSSSDNTGKDSELIKESGPTNPESPHNSGPKSVSGETSSGDKAKEEDEDGPRYEQRTMSVTRGGETIQVNYQVYIPKRAPALARRQLKR